ncbi:MAG: type II secretion system F family protein [Proteobacteria bacterium]|nr:type II secretion system F family protein [Pseudomonadota bacterium]MBU1745578.1 type II secretion system F family protein [Pseudomonadota bacterium]MBU1965914.1 type II secretion system F family protein [Pseudomonadota bacterium]
MPIFLWQAETKKGESKKGEIDAADEAAVRGQLRRQGFKSITVKKKPKDLFENIAFFQEKVTEKNVVVFCRIFSTMINAGLPLIQCLDLLGRQEENKTFSKVIGSIKADIEGGSTLTDALRKYPKIFDDLFVNLVAAGEVGGILDVVLGRLSGYMEKALKLKGQVKGAMSYPIIVLVIATLIVAGLLIFVVPTFQKMFEGMGGALPGPTQFLVDVSQACVNYWFHAIIGVLVLRFALKKYYATEKGTLFFDALILKAPIFGPLLKKVAVSRFSRTLSTMMQSGVPILEGLGIVSRTAGNKIIENALMKTKQSISEGRTIAEPLTETDVFPSMVVQMIAVGEATGALDTMLEKIADFYDDEVDAAVAGLTAMLEPLMMMILGPIVGFILIAMYLPIFKAAG